jgi:hypothetical protein
LDEKRGVLGVDENDFASWWTQILSKFDGGITPSLLNHLNIPCDGKTLVALYFGTEDLPFVIKSKNSGVDREVFYREGTATRNVKRADLIKMLLPNQRIPELEIIESSLFMAANYNPNYIAQFDFRIKLFLSIKDNNPITIVTHRSFGNLTLNDGSEFPLTTSRRHKEPIVVSTSDSVELFFGSDEFPFPSNDKTEANVSIGISVANVEKSFDFSLAFLRNGHYQWEIMN